MKTFKGYVKGVFNYNKAALSGAMDVVVIEHDNGSKFCTPFHVMFGKYRLARCHERQVSVAVNGDPVSLFMKVGKCGKAYFIPSRVLSTKSLPVGNSSFLEDDESDYDRGRRHGQTFDLSVKDNEFLYEEMNKQRAKKYKKYMKKLEDLLTDTDCFEKTVELSLSGDKSMVNFEKYRIPYELFMFNYKAILASPRLVLLIKDQIYTPEEAVPILEIQKNHFHKSKKYILSSPEIELLRLKPGLNIIEFTVGSTKTYTVQSNIFLWNEHAKIIVSDIDGTITKSDVLGHILPAFGKTWNHSHITHLYTELSNMGYHIIYLSSRALGFIKRTKLYLETINQENVRLPVGPVLISPDSFFCSLMREAVHKKADELKTTVLLQLAALFPSHFNPLFAGFGNRETDVISYRNAGIQDSKIFVVNSKSQIYTAKKTGVGTYSDLLSRIEFFF